MSLHLRVGVGYDLHRFAAGRRLVLGGVTIPHKRGLAGHSDADALTHAVIDALLGAVGRGDIGQWFPPDDPRWRDASSLDLLEQVVGALAAEGWRVENVDATIVAQEPRVMPFAPRMRANLARCLRVRDTEVNVKATTPEELGALGRAEGVAAHAVALLRRD